ncbi:class I SAM-dependent methyltransferase [Helicobacter burdigaliensis]|uniref:class I SAM-dependent methyltransferase n=1 Tax=Helicobacter burdigaliensis TaxID=2315334 RepID=UPI000EF6C207|nr:methyltransferase domain-containing protein [Helicobacter burdigaliensis]
MIKDKIKWNEKYSKNNTPGSPLELLVDFIQKAKKGKALDIACGLGRNSLFMRDCGFIVDSIDISDIGLENLQNEPNIHTFCEDLDDFNIPRDSYHLICNSYFLQRKLFLGINEGLKQGGILVFETFLYNPSLSDFSTNPSYFLQPNELLDSFKNLEILFYQEKEVEEKTHSKITQLVAKKK